MVTRRGQGLPLNTIIISIIVIVVLVVIILIFTRQMIDNRGTLNSCAVQGGDCMAEAACTAADGSNVGVLDCRETEGSVAICCVTI